MQNRLQWYKIIILGLLLLSNLTCKRHQSHQVQMADTLFYDADWKLIERDSASFYRLTSRTGDLYLVTDYYKNNLKQMEAHFSKLDPETKEGYCTYYIQRNSKSVKSREGNYSKNLKQGKWVFYDTLGTIKRTSEYSNNLLWGITEWYDSTGNASVRQTYINDVLTHTSFLSNGAQIEVNNERENEERTKDIVNIKFPDELPYEKLLKEFKANYNTRLRNSRKDTVFINFSVDTSGVVSDIKVAKGINETLDKAAVEFVKSFPKLIPATKNDELIKIRTSIPVVF